MHDELRTIGRVWMPRKPGDLAAGLVATPAIEAALDELEGRLKGRSPRSLLICGEPGTGKTALCHLLAARLVAAGWLVFEAGAGEVLAGQKYIGEVEGRIRQIVVALNGRRQLWLVPSFHELLWAGTWSKSPIGVIDNILPHVERGTLQIVGELPLAAYEHLVRERPEVRRAFVAHRVAVASEAETLELARAQLGTTATRRSYARRCCSRGSTSPTARCRARCCTSSRRRWRAWPPRDGRAGS